MVVRSNMGRTFPDQCIAIDYQQKGSGRLEGAPTCMTIVGSIRVSSPLMVTGLVLTLTAVVMSIVGSVRHSGKTVIAAILYVLTGLCIAVGIILYISAINDEVGYRTQTKGKSRDFQYYYGWSFFLAAGDFVLAEVAAVLNVTLYLRHNSRVSDMVRIIPGLEDKLQTSSFRLEADALDTRGGVTGNPQCIRSLVIILCGKGEEKTLNDLHELFA
ncbi:hypothetical protein C0Q70_00511 [Pomacea canaliculata]|uniref:Voltage-dependent calcium channel gamma-7 subunit n=1 Tax=Pomacea canaliculata TaxID=400727 RepID=A0A2T7PWW9_POMCA|nr:hypothetical protein C0Q70_00511 [Pomacea canaliculata]